MRILKILILLFSLSMLGQTTDLSEREISEFETELTEMANRTSSFSADFMQVKHMKTMENQLETKGKVYFKSPDFLKLEYAKPMDYHILFKDGMLYINEGGEKSEMDLGSNKLFQKMGVLISGCLNGKILQDPNNFEIAYSRSDNSITAKIIPQDKKLAGMFKEIYLNFGPKNLIKSVKLVDPTGDYTQINMTNLQINKPISASVFEH
tara:strand:+ start:494 stop:1117 length:624 start_codon:yes stop_codon:yes gene_type:complete